MKPLLRYSVSGLLGLMITATLFLSMLSLLSGKKVKMTTDDVNINFSFVKDFKEPMVKPKPEREKPEQQKISQAPPMEPIAMEPVNTPEVSLPNSNSTGNPLNIIRSVGLPGPGMVGDGLGQGDPGSIKSAIPPMYPPRELARKTEGWVQLLIEVDEFGHVSNAAVINAKPARVFDAAAIKAVRKWKFHPKKIDGKTSPFQVTQTIEFKLEQ